MAAPRRMRARVGSVGRWHRAWPPGPSDTSRSRAHRHRSGARWNTTPLPPWSRRRWRARCGRSCRYSTMSSTLQPPRPVRALAVRSGRHPVVQRPALQRLAGLSAASVFLGVWQAPQWPRPGHQIGAAIPFGRFRRVGLELSGWKNSRFQPLTSERMLNGKGRSLAARLVLTGATVFRNARIASESARRDARGVRVGQGRIESARRAARCPSCIARVELVAVHRRCRSRDRKSCWCCRSCRTASSAPRPPARNGSPPSRVWQDMQSPTRTQVLAEPQLRGIGSGVGDGLGQQAGRTSGVRDKRCVGRGPARQTSSDQQRQRRTRAASATAATVMRDLRAICIRPSGAAPARPGS